ncbi:unnamed protein product [Durusdinium trenchii]|uniref:Uncharacterized protein n=1 Tax=Durusdinium trenchii TaxID=1381693 RepID=A0ABP0NA99_9DINO
MEHHSEQLHSLLGGSHDKTFQTNISLQKLIFEAAQKKQSVQKMPQTRLSWRFEANPRKRSGKATDSPTETSWHASNATVDLRHFQLGETDGRLVQARLLTPGMILSTEGLHKTSSQCLSL